LSNSRLATVDFDTIIGINKIKKRHYNRGTVTENVQDAGQIEEP